MKKTHSSHSSSTLSLLFTIFFWLFNASLLLIAYIGLLPFLGTDLLADAVAGEVPLDFLIPFVGLIGVPTTCSVVGVLPKQRRAVSLFQLFYGIEAPLLMLCILRFFMLRDLTPGTSFLLLTGVFGLVSFAHWLLRREPVPQPAVVEMDATASPTHPFPPQRPDLLPTWWHLAGQTLMLTLMLYAAAVMSFYVLPFLVVVLPVLPVVVVYSLILSPILIVLLGFCSAPVGASWVYLRAWRQSLNALAARYGVWAGAFVVAVFAGWLALFLTLQRPPQIEAFKLLDTPATTHSERQALLQQQDIIRQGLINAYLAPYRYSRSNDRHIQDLYQNTVRLPEPVAQTIQTLYDTLLSPFTYPGDPFADAERARTLYAEFFDTPILRAEKPAIQKAIQSTFDRDGAKAGLADINERRVWLAEQQLTVTPQGDWAEVELYEVYDNQTFDQQEILYFFTLPESAVMTGLWLGETSDRAQRFVFDVATRGAAQQVYNQEVQRRQDPALLEQVGPRNYRLRAFPIPGRGQGADPGRMHLWLTYKVMRQDNGWALPQLLERRNLFWTDRTQRIVNGERVSAQDQWFPASLPLTGQAAAPAAHQMKLDWGAYVLATPFAQSDYRLPQNQRFAVVVDGSYSMNAHQNQLTQALQWLQGQLLPSNRADLYLTTTAPAQPQRWDDLKSFDLAKDLQQVSFYGTLQPSQMLQQFLDLRGDTAYDAILLLTDSGSYELTADRPTALVMPAPLWMVHLGGLQPAYDDATLQAIQGSAGGADTEIQTVMQRIGTQPTRGSGTTRLNVVDGYAWYLSETSTPEAQTNPEFEPLAARQWVTHLSHYVKPDELKELDTIHAITENYGIVTPYSSMLVLVNNEQREALKQAEKADDRFNREVEDQELPAPSSAMAVTAVPEPTEWLLLLAAVAIAGGVYWYPVGQSLRKSPASSLENSAKSA
ncbi:MAG: TIGR02921 family PEP-CTERM protein [Synechococcales cyanobacterium C42_A2020_086]|jgi:putative PEP-CTERM system integral membrane protein|nr:TIGR02921 family PEP-CTERM protein [Synechococcales cyanobacterium C42_A2020_086]